MHERDDDSVRVAITETKLDFLVEQVESLHAELKEIATEVRKLQAWRAYILGAAAVLAAVISFLAHWALK